LKLSSAFNSLRAELALAGKERSITARLSKMALYHIREIGIDVHDLSALINLLVRRPWL